MNTQTKPLPSGSSGISKKWIIIGIIAVVIIVLFGWCAVAYNGFVTQETNVDKTWGNVQTQYQRRKDLIPNFENTVKAYTEHESKTYTNVTAMRSGANPEALAAIEKAKGAAEKAQQAADAAGSAEPSTEQDMDYYLNAQAQAQKAFNIYVNAVHEAYPDLKSSQNFRDFQTVLEGTENRIQTARADYNKAVGDYNVKVRTFPNVVIAGIMGFQKKPMFRADADAQSAPEVFKP